MKVKFLKPDLNLLPNILGLGYSPEVDFCMQKDRTYTVYGISMWRAVLHYLVIPDNMSLPYWYPADIFEVTDPRIPPTWYFTNRRDDDLNKIKFELGYEEMIQNESHFLDLIERGTDAVRVFLARKEETENALLD